MMKRIVSAVPLLAVSVAVQAAPVNGKADSDGRLIIPVAERHWETDIPAAVVELPAGLLPDQQIELLLQNRQWEDLLGYLKSYRSSAEHDAVLADFAEAAALRGLHRPAEALPLYRRILEQNPDYRFVRLAYAQALFEDRSLPEADAEFARVGTEGLLPPTAQMLAQYRRSIAEAEEPSFDFEGNFEHNGNINQAGDSPTITVRGLTYRKSPQSLPQSDNGFRYALGWRQSWMPAGHHQFHAGAGIGGIHYFRRSEFNEQNLRLFAAYGYRTARHYAEIGPVAAYGLYGGDAYNRSLGVRLQYAYQPSPQYQWRIQHQTQYTDYLHLDGLDGRRHQGSLSLFYRPSSAYSLSGSLLYGRENTRDADSRSRRYGVSVGGEYRFVSGFNLNGTVSYVRRVFEQPHGLFGRIRRDGETAYRVGLSHRKIQWRGFMPVLNAEYYRVGSTLSDLYGRTSHQLYFSVQRQF